MTCLSDFSSAWLIVGGGCDSKEALSAPEKDSEPRFVAASRTLLSGEQGSFARRERKSLGFKGALPVAFSPYMQRDVRISHSQNLKSVSLQQQLTTLLLYYSTTLSTHQRCV